VKAVEAVVLGSSRRWLSDTLLILSADHEMWPALGPDRPRLLSALEGRGAGKVPGMMHNSHGIATVSVSALRRGPGSNVFAAMARGRRTGRAPDWIARASTSITPTFLP